MKKETKEKLKYSKTKKDLINLLIKNNKEEKVKKIKNKKLVAITACPTGIAHTFMASEKIEAAAKKLGYEFKIETQGRTSENVLTKKDIESADIVILALDKGIEGMSRFNKKKVFKTSTKEVIKDAENVIKKAEKGEGEIIKSISSNDDEIITDAYSWRLFLNVYKNLMGGVSKMLPFVVAGGIILGLAFLFDSGVTGGNLGVTRDFSGWFAGLGKLSLSIFVPILGAYTAYSIVGPEGLLPGMIAGLIASGGGLLYANEIPEINGWKNVWGRLTPGIDQSVLSAGSGFLGAMFGGYAGAFSVVILRKYLFKKVPKTFKGAVDIVAMPLFSTLIVGVIMFVFQIPLAYMAYGLKKGLQEMSNKGLLVLLTIFIGAMMAFDMGGPVNKVAYVFGVGGLGVGATSDNYIVMGAVMLAGMTPPLGIALSTIIFRKKAWGISEMESAKANWLLGSFFITEGAIPFAAKDPKRVIPSLIIGSMIAGLLVGILKIGVSAPHGGLVVISLFKSYLFSSTGIQIGMGIVFSIATLIAGALTTAFILGFWRMIDVRKNKLTLSK